MRNVHLLAAIALTVGCTTPPTAPNGEVVFVIGAAAASIGHGVRATITNESGETISVGSLPCKATWERRVGSGWVTAHQKDICNSTPQLLAHGRSITFDIDVDVIDAGTYRLFTGARWEDRDSAKDFNLTSNSIPVD